MRMPGAFWVVFTLALDMNTGCSSVCRVRSFTFFHTRPFTGDSYNVAHRQLAVNMNNVPPRCSDLIVEPLRGVFPIFLWLGKQE